MDQNIIIILTICVIILFLTFFIFKRQQLKRIHQSLLDRNHQDLIKLINHPISKILFPKVVLQNYELSSALVHQDKKRINELFNELLSKNLSLKVRKNILMQAFNYYISLPDKKHSLEILNKIKETNDQRFIQETSIMYDVYIEKGDQYLDHLLNKISENEAVYNGIDEFLISKIYENKGNKKQAAFYMEQAKLHLKEMDELLKQK